MLFIQLGGRWTTNTFTIIKIKVRGSQYMHFNKCQIIIPFSSNHLKSVLSSQRTSPSTYIYITCSTFDYGTTSHIGYAIAFECCLDECRWACTSLLNYTQYIARREWAHLQFKLQFWHNHSEIEHNNWGKCIYPHHFCTNESVFLVSETQSVHIIDTDHIGHWAYMRHTGHKLPSNRQ